MSPEPISITQTLTSGRFVVFFLLIILTIYFRSVANYTRDLDKTRPITAAIAVPSNDDKAVSFVLK